MILTGFEQQFGVHHLIPLTSIWEVAKTLAELTNGAFCNRVIEATGKQEGLDVATEAVAEGGRMMIAGYHQDGLRQVNMQKRNWKGIDVINAHERKASKDLDRIQKAIAAVEQGLMDPSMLYTNVLPFSKIEEGFRLTTDRPNGFMKGLIMMN